MNLSNIVPWVRSFADYRAMFALSDADLRGRVLGCGDGPASFNTEATALGAHVVSVDRIYMCAAVEIEARIVDIFHDDLSASREERIVDYEFQRGGNVMLRLRQGPRGQAAATT
ncbi:hypothetical protein [Methylocystis hirsuta]|uniref:SAM-dependent methyltransferase n=1 Tax=Methylocystis hirsuta TaxID=369798 RepID=A0A3M9XLA3_9HYPH|nr:hypothetical protein [Methylocystis hirsuta]RNJ48844.1 hypothetical protein D1O30_03635 [Methylocystis hirsuta]